MYVCKIFKTDAWGHALFLLLQEVVDGRDVADHNPGEVAPDVALLREVVCHVPGHHNLGRLLLNIGNSF